MTFQHFNILIPSVIILLALVGMVWARSNEKKVWNDGICKKSGKPWKSFDMDSSGARGYSDGEENDCWISYKVDAQ